VLAADKPSATWRLSISIPCRHHSATWRLLCFLLGASQAPHGAWATYKFSIITSIDIKNIIISFLNIPFVLE
jgi:hypothetical protein